MNREALRANLAVLVVGAIPRNARRIHCVYFDDQPTLHALGLRVDPRPVEGRVVAHTDEAFLVKTGCADFVAVNRTLATLCPAAGEKVRVTP